MARFNPGSALSNPPHTRKAAHTMFTSNLEVGLFMVVLGTWSHNIISWTHALGSTLA